jgi:hypothetical protein
MLVKKLIALADSLDKKGHRDLANVVDGILRSYAEEEEAPEDAQDDDSEDASDEATTEDGPEASDDGAEVEVEVTEEAPAAAPAEDNGMLGSSWYGDAGEQGWDLSGPAAGSMQDHRDPGFCADSAGAPAEAPPVDDADESAEADAEDADGGEADEAGLMGYKLEVAKKLAALADALDLKGLVAEANFVDATSKKILGVK